MSQGRSEFSDSASRAVLDSAPEGILVADQRGQIVHANAHTEELFGYAPDELLGLHFDIILPESFRQEHQRQIAGYRRAPGLRPGRIELELRGLCKDGTDFLLEMSLCSVDVQDGPLVCCVLRKIAGPETSEHPAREVEQRFRLMVENSQDILTLRDADARVRYTSHTGRIQTEAEKERVIAELREAISKLDALTGLLAICASCKKVHAENGSWQQIESYIRDRSQVEFTHTMCPECSKICYPGHFQK